MAISISRPTVGGSEDTWGATINTGLQAIESTLNGTGTGKVTVAPDLSTLTINGTDVTSTAAELNLLDGKTAQDFLPSGVILLWSGSIATIPTGWVLCDGTNSTPDLRDRFVVGADADSGGEAIRATRTHIPVAVHQAERVTVHAKQNLQAKQLAAPRQASLCQHPQVSATLVAAAHTKTDHHTMPLPT
jgi:hypothetical protein